MSRYKFGIGNHVIHDTESVCGLTFPVSEGNADYYDFLRSGAVADPAETTEEKRTRLKRALRGKIKNKMKDSYCSFAFEGNSDEAKTYRQSLRVMMANIKTIADLEDPPWPSELE